MSKGVDISRSNRLEWTIARSVHPRFGIINALTEDPPAPAAYGVHVATAWLSCPEYYRSNAVCDRKTVDRGSGAGFTREAARWSALGEAIERYSASIYWPDRLVIGSALELGTRALDLRAVIRVESPGIVPVGAACRYHWIEGKDLESGTPLLVPASMVFLGFSAGAPDEKIVQSDSTGLACAATQDQACLNAICEVIERDVFSSAWLLRRRPPRLNIDNIGDGRGDGAGVSDQPGPCVRFYHLSWFCQIHVVMSVVTQNGVGVVAAAAHPSILTAVEKAQREGLHCWAAAQPFIGRDDLPTADNLSRPADHLLHYLAPDRFAAIENWIAGDDEIDAAGLLDAPIAIVTVSQIASALKLAGLTAVSINLTTRDVEALGLHVMRVVIPGTQPLIFGPGASAVPDPRRLAYWSEQWRLDDPSLNPLPHPFP